MDQSRDLSAAEGVLRAAEQHVREARVDVTRQCQQLGQNIAGIGGDWGGEGARAFQRVHTTWQEKQSRIVRALDDFAESLLRTDRDNIATDTAQAEASARLLARLG